MKIKSNIQDLKFFPGFDNRNYRNNKCVTSKINLNRYFKNRFNICEYKKLEFLCNRFEERVKKEDKGCHINFING